MASTKRAAAQQDSPDANVVGAQQDSGQTFISEILAGGPQQSQTPSGTTEFAPPTEMLSEDILGQIQRVALNTAQQQITQAAPQLLKNLEDYAQQYTGAVLAGHDPSLIPAVTVYTQEGKQLTRIDAKNRSFRTLLQGFGIDTLFAVVAGIGALSGVNFFDKAGLATLGILVSKTVVQTAVSYVARMKVTPQYQK